MVTVTKTPFITALGHTIVGTRSRPLTSRGTELVNVHTEMLREVNKIFDNRPSNLGGGGLGPLGPLRTFKIFWIVNGESKQTTITTKHVLSSTT